MSNKKVVIGPNGHESKNKYYFIQSFRKKIAPGQKVKFFKKHRFKPLIDVLKEKPTSLRLFVYQYFHLKICADRIL